MMFFHAAQGIVPYIQPESYQSCYAVLRFKRSLPDRCQASLRSGSRQTCPCMESRLHDGHPWIEGEDPSEVVAVQPRDRGDGPLTS